MSDVSHNRKLLTFSSGGWVILLSAILSIFAAILVLRPAFQTGFRSAIGDGIHPESYGFDLSNLAVPRNQLIASGAPKNGIRAIEPSLVETVTPANVDLINKVERANERGPFLVSSDRIVGVTVGTESRAYPVRILNIHEVVNDKLGGVPIAVTWSPWCDSAVVFDRRIDGPESAPAEFGVSGLLVNSNLIFFDRRSDPKQESLWLQLTFRAIAGPAAGKQLALIPYTFTTWAQWRAAHPDTRVILGLRTLEQQYKDDTQTPYNLYLANDELKYPVAPLWPETQMAKKTQIIASSGNGVKWTVHVDLTPDATEPARDEPYRIHSFIFAWYAFHSADTQY